MANVYILYSEKIALFYTGSCAEFDFRHELHLSKHFPGSFTVRADDWVLFFRIDDLGYRQARLTLKLGKPDHLLLLRIPNFKFETSNNIRRP
jgi:hypothetical protein